MKDRSGYMTSDLCTVIDLRPATLRAWRNRHGLFPHTKDATGWNHYTIIDLCVAMLAKSLIDKKFQTQAAIDIAEAIRPYFDDLIHEDADAKLSINSDAPTILFVDISDLDGADPDVLVVDGESRVLDAVLTATPRGPEERFCNGIAIAIELISTLNDVVRGIKHTQAPKVLSPKQTEYRVFKTLADSIREGLDEMRDEDTSSEDKDE